MLAILGGLLSKFRFRDSFNVSVLFETTFVLGQVIDFVVTQGEVRLDTAHSGKNFIGLGLPVLDSLHLVGL